VRPLDQATGVAAGRVVALVADLANGLAATGLCEREAMGVQDFAVHPQLTVSTLGAALRPLPTEQWVTVLKKFEYGHWGAGLSKK
jgi:hypothetical protein